MVFLMFTVEVPYAMIVVAPGSLGGIHSWPYKFSKSVGLIISAIRSQLTFGSSVGTLVALSLRS